MTKDKISQREANKRWEQNNREYSNYLKGRSACKSFIKNKATLEDLKEIERLIKEKYDIDIN